MSNPRITAKERNLIKGALRRVFSRSELRKRAIEKVIDPNHVDLSRPRVKTWCLCPACHKHYAKSEMQVDHEIPIVPVDSSLEQMSWDDVVNRIWCPEHNLKAICEDCHTIKTRRETKERAVNKRRNKK